MLSLRLLFQSWWYLKQMQIVFEKGSVQSKLMYENQKPHNSSMVCHLILERILQYIKTRFLTKIFDMGNASKWCYLLYFRLAHYYYMYVYLIQI